MIAPSEICLFVGKAWPEWVAVNQLLRRLFENDLKCTVVLIQPKSNNRQLPKKLSDVITIERDTLWDVVVPELNGLATNELADSICKAPKQWRDLYHTDFLETADPNSSELKDQIVLRNIRLGLNLRGLAKFKPDTISFFNSPPRLGLWNVHTAKLPEYRGVNPLFWVMKNKESDNFLSLHHIDERLDTGSKIAQRAVGIDYQKSLFWNYLSHGDAMAELMHPLIIREFSGIRNFGTTQTDHNAGYYTYPTSTDIEAFEQLGNKLMHPSDIENALDEYVQTNDIVMRKIRTDMASRIGSLKLGVS